MQAREEWGDGGESRKARGESEEAEGKRLQVTGRGRDPGDAGSVIGSRTASRALVHFHRTVGTATFRRREARAGALWFHFDQATIAYALNPRRSPCPPDVTAVHDLEGHDLLARAGESLKIEGQPMYLSR